MLPDGTGLNLLKLSLLKYLQKATIIESSKAGQSTVDNEKVFFLPVFMAKSSRNLLKFVYLSLSLLMHRTLNAGNLSWDIATL